MLRRTIAATAAVGATCVAYGALVERRWYRLRHLEVSGALHEGAAAPLRILHLSDLHLDPPQGHKIEFLDEVARHDVDLVVMTGDLLGAVDAEEDTIAALSTVLAGRPSVLVLGSNDLYGPTPKHPFKYFTDPDARMHGPRLDTKALIAGLADLGTVTLRNERTVLETSVGQVAVGGIDDPHLNDTLLPEPEAIAPMIDDAVLDLGLVHAPYTAALDLLVDTGHDLLLAGHTHGGQVRFPPIGAVVGNCDLPLDQVRGLSTYRGRKLHVSPGIGTSRYAPFRFACRPEATILTLLP